jgi:apolipoprotein N-acyltransferase
MRVVPWVALAPLVALALVARRPLLLGWLHGFVTWAVAMRWIAPTLETYGELPAALAYGGLAFIGVWLGVYHGLFAWAVARMRSVGPVALVLGSASAWVALEWLRGWIFSGFPWNLAAYAVIEVPGALAASSWLGPWGVSFLVALVGAAAAVAVRDRKPKLFLGFALVPLVVLPVTGRLADQVRQADQVGAPGGQALAVRIIQPNAPNMVGYDAVAVEAQYRELWALTEAACDEPGALIVWPESAAWPRRVGADDRLDQDLARLLDRGCAILVNSATLEGEQWFNSVWRLDPTLAPARADKRHLVPFGEYVPLGNLVPFIGRLARNAGDFSPARALTLIPVAGEQLGLAVCYEIVFPAEVADLVQAGATMLVTVTNDAWYGDTAAPWQHLAAARFRAAELRRPLLRAAITGVSALVDPRGQVVEQLGVGVQGTIRARVRGRLDTTVAGRFPWLGPALAWAGTLVVLALARHRIGADPDRA